MDKANLLAEFKAQLEQYDKFQSFIEKAQEMSDKFNPAVVEKVISDNTAKLDGVAEALDPMVSDMTQVIADLEQERADTEQGVSEARMAVEELELRKAIGEIDDDEYGTLSSEHQSNIESADATLEALGTELEDFKATLERWTSVRGDLGETAEDDLLGELEDDDAFGGDDDVFAGDDEAFGDEGRGEGVHLQQTSVTDDVSAVFEDDDADDEDDASDGDDDDAIPAEGIAFGEDELADLADDILADAPVESADDAEEVAVLVAAEGTDEEVVYPFSGEVISLGRGRDNTVQVKNDSKVSRYHCKLYKRDGAYWIEDNKSANGTLVDGELITEKQLTGGEEVIIGETFFRFRVA